MSRVDEAMKRALGKPQAEVRTSGPYLFEGAREEMPVSVAEYPKEASGSFAAPAGDAGGPSVRLENPGRAAQELPERAIAAPRTGSARPLGRLAEEVEGKIVIDAGTSVASIEEYRRLAAALHQMQQESGLRTLMISSPLPRDGKTLTSTNLALTLSESYQRRVLLIDADLRRPSVHHVFGLPNLKGLADGLRSSVSGTLPLIEVSPHLTILPAGPADQSPMAGLTSDRMRSVISEASARFDWVILDSPPIGLMSDANLMAGLVDGVLLVIGAGKTEYSAVARAVAAFGRERIVGIVLNRVHDEARANERYQDYYQIATH